MPDARFTVDGSGRAMPPLWHLVHGCRAEGIRPDEALQTYGEDVGLLWNRAVAIGALDGVKPFVTAADEFRTSIPISRPVRS